MDIGATLREARERRGLSLESVSLRTKISVEQLRAIEINAFDLLPAPVFALGFLKAFAREVGLDSAQVVSQYQHVQHKDATPAPAAEAPTTPGPTPIEEDEPATRFGWLTLRPGHITALLIVAVGLYVFARPARWRSQPQTSTGAVAAAAPQPPAPETAQPVPTPVATAGQPLQITLRVSRPCWISATADGQRVLYRTLQPGEQQTIPVLDALALRVGDAGALALAVDGAPARSLGGSGQPVSVRLTRENFREILEPARQ
jgi:cytoskeletal protein RodZ